MLLSPVRQGFIMHKALSDFSRFVGKPNQMKALVVKAKNQSEMKFISELLDKLGIPSTVMEIEELEDQAMSILMKKADRNKKVSRETIMKKLKAS